MHTVPFMYGSWATNSKTTENQTTKIAENPNLFIFTYTKCLSVLLRRNKTKKTYEEKYKKTPTKLYEGKSFTIDILVISNFKLKSMKNASNRKSLQK